MMPVQEPSKSEFPASPLMGSLISPFCGSFKLSSERPVTIPPMVQPKEKNNDVLPPLVKTRRISTPIDLAFEAPDEISVGSSFSISTFYFSNIIKSIVCVMVAI